MVQLANNFNPLTSKISFVLGHEAYPTLESLSDFVESELNECFQKSIITKSKLYAFSGQDEQYSTHYLASLSHSRGKIAIAIWMGERNILVAKHLPLCTVAEIKCLGKEAIGEFLNEKLCQLTEAMDGEIKEAIRIDYEFECEENQNDNDY